MLCPLLVFLFLRLMCVGVLASFDYCVMPCVNGTPHTLCKYPAGGGSLCSNNVQVYLRRREKVYILEVLNNMRQSVAKGGEVGRQQPPAGNMMKLVWDIELETIAKRWADQCREPLHDLCRRTMDGNQVGQTSFVSVYHDTGSINMDKVAERSARINTALTTWFQEVEVMDPKNVPSYDPTTMADTDNYTQLVWGNTVYIGCGYTEFDMGDETIMYRFICDYKPAGNVVGLRVYRKGEPCSTCPRKTTCSITWAGLCWNGEENDFTDNPSVGRRIPSPAILQLGILSFIPLFLYLHQSLSLR